MPFPLHPGRIVDPVAYRASSGRVQRIPVGPCLIEQIDAGSMNIVWGANGQRCAVLPLATVQAARARGSLQWLS
jgi:hypothetical protein